MDFFSNFYFKRYLNALYDNVHTGTMASTNYRYLDIIKNSLNGNNSEVHMNKIVWTDLPTLAIPLFTQNYDQY